MGNCQAAEAATVVIQHPKGRVERIYWSVSAKEVMNSNPGHYVAIATASLSTKSANATPARHLKILRPDDTLHIGHVYRLVSFEEVLKEMGGKKYTRLSKLISMQREKEKEKNGCDEATYGADGGGEEEGTSPSKQQESSDQVEEGERDEVCGVGRSSGTARHHRQWRPALQSIAEIGS